MQTQPMILIPKELRSQTIIRSCELRNVLGSDNDGKMTLDGYAATLDSPTVLYEIDGIEYKETLDRNAFVGTDMSDCCLKYNHFDGQPPLARVRGGSLQLSVDVYGLKFNANLFDIQIARDIYTLVKGGGLDRCSFAFTVAEDSYDAKTRTRTILKIDKLYDVSVVDVPAYGDTSVSARSFFELVREKELALVKAEQNLRNELIVRSYL